MAEIRKARKSDLERIEYICRMTAGELSRTNEKVGTTTARIYSTYYARECTDTSFVLTDESDTAVGYILCEPSFKRFRKLYRKKDVKNIAELSKKDAFTAWFFPTAYGVFARKYPAHMHIDLLPEYQGKGYGTKMLNVLFDTLKQKNVRGLMLMADIDNKGAIRFYERSGFTVLCKAAHGVVMAKTL